MRLVVLRLATTGRQLNAASARRSTSVRAETENVYDVCRRSQDANRNFGYVTAKKPSKGERQIRQNDAHLVSFNDASFVPSSSAIVRRWRSRTAVRGRL